MIDRILAIKCRCRALRRGLDLGARNGAQSESLLDLFSQGGGYIHFALAIPAPTLRFVNSISLLSLEVDIASLLAFQSF